MAMTSSQAHLVGTVIELLVMGAYTLTFTDHMKIMYRKRSRSAPYIYLLCTSVIIFALCCVHAITDIWRIYTGFTRHTGVPNSPDAFFNQNNTWDSWVRTTTFDTITVVSDLFFVSRTWVVWDKSYLICTIPFLLFLTDVGTVAYLLWSLAHSSDDPAFAGLLVANASKYFFAVTLALTLTCTLLVAYKLWSTQRKFQPVPSGYTGEYVFSRLSQVATIIVESAAIYSSFLVALIVTDTLGIEGFFILLTMIPPIIGIIFSSIIVRTMKVNKKKASGATINSTVRFRSQRQETDEIAYTTTSGLSSDGLQLRLEAITQTESSTRGTEESKQKWDAHAV